MGSVSMVPSVVVEVSNTEDVSDKGVGESMIMGV